MDTKLQQWASEVLERDDYTCPHCGADTNLDAAHIHSRGARPDLSPGRPWSPSAPRNHSGVNVSPLSLPALRWRGPDKEQATTLAFERRGLALMTARLYNSTVSLYVNMNQANGRERRPNVHPVH